MAKKEGNPKIAELQDLYNRVKNGHDTKNMQSTDSLMAGRKKLFPASDVLVYADVVLSFGKVSLY